MKKLVYAIVLVFTCTSGFAIADPSALVKLAPARLAHLAPQVTGYGLVGADPNFVTAVFTPRESIVETVLARPGQKVKAGDPLLSVRATPAATATYQQAVSAADLASKDYDRAKRLFAEQLATRSQLAAAAKADSDARTQLSALRNVGGDLVQTLKAPVTGIVASLTAARGDPLQPGTTVATVAAEGHVVLNLGVEPRDAYALRPGNMVLIPAQQGLPLIRTRVEAVGGMVDPTSHLVNVLASLPASAQVLMGTALRGQIDLAPVSGVVVPRSALLDDNGASYLFVARGGKAYRRNVKLAFENGPNALIASGLKANEMVVIDGMVGLTDGMTLRTGK